MKGRYSILFPTSNSVSGREKIIVLTMTVYLVHSLLPAFSKMGYFSSERTGLLYGYIDRSGTFVVRPSLSKAIARDVSGFALVEVRSHFPGSQYTTKAVRPDFSEVMTPSDIDVLTIPKQSQMLCKWKDRQLVSPKANSSRAGLTFCSTGGKILPLDFDTATEFGDGIAAVTRNGLLGFVRANGKYSMIPELSGCTALASFSEGLLPVRKNEVCGYLNKTGQWHIQPRFRDAKPFSDGLALVELDGSNDNPKVFTFIDYSGNQFANRFVSVTSFEQGVAAAAVWSKETSALWGLVDRKGVWIAEPNYLMIGPLRDGLRVFMRDDLYGYMDNTGKVIIKPTYLSAGSFSEGLAPVTSKDSARLQFVDRTGKVIIGAKFNQVNKITADWPVFSEGLCAMTTDNGKYPSKWGFIDHAGKWKILPQFEEAKPFKNGFAVVGIRRKQGQKFASHCQPQQVD